MEEIKSINYADDLHCISRICQTRIRNGKPQVYRTWYVRIKSKNKTAFRFVKSFPDKKYGDESSALLAAKKYRDNILNSNDLKIRQIESFPDVLKPYDPAKRLALRKACGQSSFELGSGIDAALQAKEMGASRFIINKVYVGKGQTYRPCYRIPKFEVYGFRNAASITKTLDLKIRRLVRFKTSNQDIIGSVTQNVLLAYASLDTIKQPVLNQDHLLKSLVNKYFKQEITSIYRRKNKIRFLNPHVIDSCSYDDLKNLNCLSMNDAVSQFSSLA